MYKYLPEDFGTVGRDPAIIGAFLNVTAPSGKQNTARLSRDWSLLLSALDRAEKIWLDREADALQADQRKLTLDPQSSRDMRTLPPCPQRADHP